MQFRLTLCTAAAMGAVALSTQAGAQERSAEEVVSEAVEALEGISAVSYRIHLSAGGAIADQAPTIEGEILLQERPEAEIPLVFRGEGAIIAPAGAPGDGARERFLSSYDGEQAYGVNYDDQTLYTGDLGAGGLDLLTGTLELIIDAFVVEAPLGQERAAFEMTLLKQEEVDGVLCDVVEFQYEQSTDAGSARWWFGAEDRLPRRVQRMMTLPAGDASVTYALSDIDSSPDPAEDAFMIPAPEGFETKVYDTTGLLPLGSQAPGFALTNDKGEEVALDDLRGQVVVLDFWATWCGPCKVAMPGIQELHEEFAEEPVAIYGVNVWEQGPAQAAIDYFREENYTYGLLLNGDSVANAYRVTGIPTFYVIGPDGAIVHRSVGAAGEEVLRKVIRETLPAS